MRQVHTHPDGRRFTLCQGDDFKDGDRVILISNPLYPLHAPVIGTFSKPHATGGTVTYYADRDGDEPGELETDAITLEWVSYKAMLPATAAALDWVASDLEAQAGRFRRLREQLYGTATGDVDRPLP
jgi:hypothetical protein